MIKRIVKLSFHPENIESFKIIFEESKNKIIEFDGCKHVELLCDTLHTNIFFTLSYWDSEEALNNYRNSTLFELTWAKTKVLFNDKPMAWSLNHISKPDLKM
jgi:heme-degrading monooxygenase HmoA